jgi:hypothetical protein
MFSYVTFDSLSAATISKLGGYILQWVERDPVFKQNCLKFSLLAGNFGGDGFEPDCVLRHQVVTRRDPTRTPWQIGKH